MMITTKPLGKYFFPAIKKDKTRKMPTRSEIVRKLQANGLSARAIARKIGKSHTYVLRAMRGEFETTQAKKLRASYDRLEWPVN